MSTRSSGVDHRAIVQYLKAHARVVVTVTAESCTAGLIASRLAAAPGAGEVLECACGNRQHRRGRRVRLTTPTTMLRSIPCRAFVFVFMLATQATIAPTISQIRCSWKLLERHKLEGSCS